MGAWKIGEKDRFMKNIIVTGGLGYIGSVIVEKLLEKQYAGLNPMYKVFVIDNKSTCYTQEMKHERVKYYNVDITDITALDDVFRSIRRQYGEIDAIFHLAALSVVSESNEKEKDYHRVNVKGTESLVLMANSYRINKFLFASSAAVYNYGGVTNGYSRTKQLAEKELLKLSPTTSRMILRLYNVIGATEKSGENRKKETHLIPLILDNIHSGKEMQIFETNSYRDYIDVRDVANTFIESCENMTQRKNSDVDIIDICSGIPTSNQEIIDECERVTGKKLNYIVKERRPFDPSKIVGPRPVSSNLISIRKSIESANNWILKTKFKNINNVITDKLEHIKLTMVIDHKKVQTELEKLDKKTISDNPKLRVGNTKVGFQSIPPSSFVYMAKAMNDGANKYGARNWRESEVIMSIYLDAMMRHLLCVMDGEDVAEDSKIEHLAHIMANCAIILDGQRLGVLIDDRKSPGDVSEILQENIKGK
jgi:UDP-glucose 4-epimerase